jgi:hypothetical protein
MGNNHWRSLNEGYSHDPEFVVAAKLNALFVHEGVRADRPVGSARDKYSPQDVMVHTFDRRSLTFGKSICKIDVECKINDVFAEYPFPPKRWHSWSFLARKVDKASNRDQDIYLLVDRELSDRIFWITYGAIRGFFSLVTEADEWSVRDRFYRAPIESPISVQTGYPSICRYISGLRDGNTNLLAFGVVA